MKQDKQKVKAFKKQVKAVFSELRSHGFVARMNFSCCSTCGSYELSEKARDLGLEKVVFYRQQDEAALLSSGELSVRYFSMNEDKDRTADTLVGSEVFDMLRKHGVYAEWERNPNVVIKAFIEGYNTSNL